MCTSTINRFGATPASIQWKVVRGDTAKLSVDFFELDETTGFDCTGWTYEATTYDSSGDVLDQLVVTSDDHSITITAPASLTVNWGSGYKNVVSELPFDLQVNIPAVGENTIWTPIIGTITVLGDVTPGGSL
jgi:hypothetical protein